MLLPEPQQFSRPGPELVPQARTSALRLQPAWLLLLPSVLLPSVLLPSVLLPS